MERRSALISGGNDQDDTGQAKQAHDHKQEHSTQQGSRLEGQPGQAGAAPGEEQPQTQNPDNEERECDDLHGSRQLPDQRLTVKPRPGPARCICPEIILYGCCCEWAGPVKIHIEDILTSPTVLAFSEEAQELDQFLSSAQATPEYRVEAPAHIRLSHFRSGHDLFFDGSVQTTLCAQCVRCLETYTFPLDRSFSAVLQPTPRLGREIALDQDELSASFYHGEHVDVSVLVHEQIMLALPSAPVCYEACQGLCSQCGINLNQDSCACQPSGNASPLALLSSVRIAPQGVIK